MPQFTRLAPSPTGALHMGNARTFLINWLLARQNGWRIILRIEDIDSPRIKPGSDRQAIADLHWLGIDWDEGPIHQTTRLSRYRAAIERLIDAGQAYPCVCSRKEVELAASAPHPSQEAISIYPGTCRDRFTSIDQARRITGKSPAIRFRVPEERCVTFRDEFCGEVTFDVARQLGDFVIAKADSTPAYQLAVVVDDAEMNVTQVIRGDDLLDSTPRQLLLYEAMGLTEKIPSYAHVPLIIGPDGRRLAKRHGDTRLAFHRERGVCATQMLRMLSKWCGIDDASDVQSAVDLIGRFSLDRLSRQPVVYDPSRGL